MRLSGYTSSVSAVDFSPDGRRLLSVGGNGNVIIQDLHEDRRSSKWKLEEDRGAHDAIWCRDEDSTIVAIVEDIPERRGGPLTLWRVGALEKPFRIWRFPEDDRQGHDFRSVAVSCDGARLAAGAVDGSVLVWDVTNLSDVRLLHEFFNIHTECINSLVFLDDEGKWLVSASGNPYESQEHLIGIWDCGAGTQHAIYDEHSDTVWALAWSPDRSELASASNDGTVRLWLVEWVAGGPRLKQPPERVLEGHTGPVKAVAFHPILSEKRLATGSDDRTIRLWDLETCLEVATLRGHIGAVNDLAFEPRSGRRLASASRGWGGY